MASRDEVIRFLIELTGDEKVAAAVADFVKAGDAAGETQGEFEKLAKAASDAADKTSLIGKAISQKAGLTELRAQLDKAVDTYNNLANETDKSVTSSKKYETQLNSAKKAVTALSSQINVQSVALQKTEGALAKADVDTGKLATEYVKAQSAGAALVQKISDLASTATKSATATDKAAKSTSDLGDKASHSGDFIDTLKEHLVEIISAATAVELALKGIEFGKESIAGASEVEASVSRIKATATGAAAEFDKLEGAIDEAARAANVSNKEAAAAAVALAQQGQSAAQIIQTLTPTLLLAKDATVEVGEAAGIVDDILDLFKKDAGDAADIVDKLVVASKGSKEGLSGMAAAIRQLAPDATQLGISLDQIIGLLGFLSQNGIDAAKAVRGLRSIFQDLEEPASKFSLALANAGDSSGDFGKAIETIRNGGKLGQDALLTLTGAARSLVAFLVQQAPDAVNGFTASLANASGAAQTTAKAIDDNLKGSFTAFENSLDRLGEKLATPVLKPLADEFSKLADQVNAFSESPQFTKLAGKIGKLFASGAKAFDDFIQKIDWDKFVTGAQNAVNDAGKSIKQLKSDFDTLADSINAVGKFFANLGSLDQSGGKALGGIIDAIGQLGHASTALAAGDMPAVVAAVDAAKASFNKARDGAKEFGDALDGTKANFDNVEGGANKVADSVADIADGAGTAAEGLGKLGEVGPGVFENTAGAANAAAAAVKDHNQAILDAEAAVDKAHKAFQDLVESGNASAEAMLKAKNAYDEAQDSLDKLTGKTDDAVNSQRALESAFATLGITTQDKLDQAATAATNALDTINKAFLAGNATLADVQRAYDAYAKTVRASVADSTAAIKSEAEAHLATEAALLGVTDAAQKAGKAGKDAGDNIDAGMRKAKDSADKVKASVDAIGESATRIGHETGDEFSKRVNGWADSLAAAATAAASAAAGIRVLTADQLRSFEQISQEFNSGAISVQQYEDKMSDAINGTTIELDKQLDTLRKFKDEVNDLQSAIAGANGDDVSVENLRHEKKLQDIKDEQDLTLAQQRQLEELEEQLHQANLKRIKDENTARAAPPDTPAPSGGGDSGGSSDGGGGTGGRGGPVNVTFNVTGLLDDKGIDSLARRVGNVLQNIERRSM